MKKLILAAVVSALPVLVFAQNPDRSKAPDLGPIQPLVVPAMETFKLSNGIPVYFVRKDQVPLLQINLVVSGGSAFEKPSELGLANLTTDLMTEGAGKRDALALADEIDFLGIRLDAYAGSEFMGVNLFAPTSRVDQALDLMKDVVLNPTFPETELNRIRKSKLVSLGQNHDEARVIASTAFSQIIFGKEHAFGRGAAGTETTLKSFTPKEVKSFHTTYFNSKNAWIVVAGAIDQKTLKNKLETAFGKMKAGKSFETPKLPVPSVAGRVIYLIDKPGAAQSELRIGHAGVNRMTPDYFNLTVVNTILGGSFTSRLNQNIREEHGYAYGASSRFGFQKNTGAFLAASAVQTEVTDSAIYEFMKELNGIAEISEQDLSRARNYVALSFPSDFADVQSIADNIVSQIFYGLPKDYFNSYTGNILNVKLDAAVKTAKNYIRTDNLVIVVVGDKAKIEEKIKGLNLGEIKYMSIEDVLGPVPQI